MWLQNIGKGLVIQEEHLVVELVVLCSALYNCQLLGIYICRKIELGKKKRSYKYSGLSY
jgi:hypothetical protein